MWKSNDVLLELYTSLFFIQIWLKMSLCPADFPDCITVMQIIVIKMNENYKQHYFAIMWVSNDWIVIFGSTTSLMGCRYASLSWIWFQGETLARHLHQTVFFRGRFFVGSDVYKLLIKHAWSRWCCHPHASVSNEFGALQTHAAVPQSHPHTQPESD